MLSQGMLRFQLQDVLICYLRKVRGPLQLQGL